MNDQPDHNPYAANPQHHVPPMQGQYVPYAPGMTYAPYPPQPAEPRHAELGIASLALSIFCGLGLFAMFVIAGVMQATTPGGMDEESPAVVILGLLLIGAFLLTFLALALGIGSLFQPNRKKLLGILGLAGSLVVILLFGTLMIVGMIVG